MCVCVCASVCNVQSLFSMKQVREQAVAVVLCYTEPPSVPSKDELLENAILNVYA